MHHAFYYLEQVPDPDKRGRVPTPRDQDLVERLARILAAMDRRGDRGWDHPELAPVRAQEALDYLADSRRPTNDKVLFDRIFTDAFVQHYSASMTLADRAWLLSVSLKSGDRLFNAPYDIKSSIGSGVTVTAVLPSQRCALSDALTFLWDPLGNLPGVSRVERDPHATRGAVRNVLLTVAVTDDPAYDHSGVIRFEYQDHWYDIPCFTVQEVWHLDTSYAQFAPFLFTGGEE